MAVLFLNLIKLGKKIVYDPIKKGKWKNYKNSIILHDLHTKKLLFDLYQKN